MNMDEFREVATNELARDLIEALRCKVQNSEGKNQTHDWSDTYKRWGLQRWYWKIWYPVRMMYRQCVRCGYEARRLR